MLRKSDKLSSVNSDTLTEGGGNSIQNIKYAQYNMRMAYLNGSSGVLVSGSIWLIAGLVAIYLSPNQAVWTLLIGGAFIHPISVLLTKILGATGTHVRDNPLGSLALEGTIFMIMCLPIAYIISFQKLEWFFQSMLLVIGGRYLTFATLYGTRLYWILGIGLGIAAYLLFALNATSYISIFVGSAIELIFGFILLTLAHRQ